MKLDVVLGLQWGDEGKGKIVDVLAGNYPVVARFQGGPNAGHSLPEYSEKTPRTSSETALSLTLSHSGENARISQRQVFL